jgi:cytidine deaminase
LKKKVEIIQVKVETNVVNDELNNQESNLLEKAIEASKNAYAPYSRFNVGAAVLLEDGTLLKGQSIGASKETEGEIGD